MSKTKIILMLSVLVASGCVINEVPIKSGDVPALDENYSSETNATPIDKPFENTLATKEPENLIPSDSLNEVDMSCNGGIYKLGNPYTIDGVQYTPFEDFSYSEEGMASWYGHGDGFNEKATANGETYSKDEMTAAHRTLPLPSVVKVTNLENGKSVLVRVNDRGPFARDRIIDLSQAAAQKLGYEAQGSTKVKVEIDAEKTSALKESMQKCLGKVEKVTEYVKDGTFYVQVGAFTDKARAEKQMEANKGFGPIHIQESDVNGVHFHRVQIGPYEKLLDVTAKLKEVRQKSPSGAGLVKDAKWVPNA
jgi:rare lipoprotein A